MGRHVAYASVVVHLLYKRIEFAKTGPYPCTFAGSVDALGPTLRIVRFDNPYRGVRQAFLKKRAHTEDELSGLLFAVQELIELRLRGGGGETIRFQRTPGLSFMLGAS